MNLADEIKRLHELHQSGVLTDAEFTQAKAKLLVQEHGHGTDSTYSQQSSSVLFNADKSRVTLNRFRRSRSDQWIGGICGGLAKFTGLDSWAWRLLFVLFTFYFGFGLVAYLLAWIFVPEEE
jgi:phage shock protein C